MGVQECSQGDTESPEPPWGRDMFGSREGHQGCQGPWVYEVDGTGMDV